MYQRNIKDIKSIAPGYNLTAKEYATVWQFADKYDISKFPEYVGSSLEQTKASQDLMAQINAASEYLKHNAMNPATASTRLNQATVWHFADKYNITEFPKYTGDIYDRRAASQEFMEQITNADEYVESTNMSTETASNLLNQAFAVTNNNLVNILKSN